ncbi:hypothetical protein EVG20_g9787 [Dentipellis fragilis]|uniref:Uncharacterized protein n=1 Tax=Dentipellis fragilis TaxID=205917 RepID=A0A4Y9Y058_9AGAM|nr:hypothetical protein EVG20_g9787 [Dentipellis fragilis]
MFLSQFESASIILHSMLTETSSCASGKSAARHLLPFLPASLEVFLKILASNEVYSALHVCFVLRWTDIVVIGMQVLQLSLSCIVAHSTHVHSYVPVISCRSRCYQHIVQVHAARRNPPSTALSSFSASAARLSLHIVRASHVIAVDVDDDNDDDDECTPAHIDPAMSTLYHRRRLSCSTRMPTYTPILDHTMPSNTSRRRRIVPTKTTSRRQGQTQSPRADRSR